MPLDNGLMYLGTRERAQWVKAAAPGAGFSSEGYSERIAYLNGGAGLRNSVGAHMEYDFTWQSISRDQVSEIENYAYGLYGDGLIYFVDPYAMDRNLFSMQWSVPKITAEDGIPLTGTARPAKILLGDMALGYPMYGAQYSVTAGQAARKFHCPIPPGHTAWVGAHGSAGAKGLIVQPTLNGANVGASTAIPVLATNTSTRFSTSVDNGAANGIDVSIDTTTTTTITLAGLMLQVLPTGVTPDDGGFISGRGNSGCMFDGKPKRMPYSLPGESIGMTATLVEIGDWI
jgi:hypothetical protein